MNRCIYRGTTPRITLNVKGVDLSDASIWPVVIVTIGNGRNISDVMRDKITATKIDSDCTLSFELTQEQTLAFSTARQVQVQLRAKDVGGHAIASPIASVEVKDVIKDGEI